MQVPPPVDVMRTEVAVTEPLLAAGPKAATQSPTASALEDTVCVVFTGVELDVVTLIVSVLGFVRVLLLPFLLLDLLRCVKLPGEIEMPETVSVDPLTAVTLPDAMSRLATGRRRLPCGPPFWKTGGGPPDGPSPEPVRN